MMQQILFILLFFSSILSNTIAESRFSKLDTLAIHKYKFIDNIKNNPIYKSDQKYQMQRAIKTILGDDCDYIPKVEDAGKIFISEPYSYQVMHNGIKIILNSYYDVQWITDVISALKGHHEPQEEKCFYEVLKTLPENATMIELGSFWGYYSIWFSSQIKGAKNYLIEPDPKRLEIGKKNFSLNNLSAEFRRGFVGTMKDDEPDISGAKWISIDDFIEEENIDHIHILHSDVQGAEADMLMTTINHLDIIDYFFISTHGYEQHQKCLFFFKLHDFKIVAEHQDIESCSGDGLIVAKRAQCAGVEHISIKKY